jgi:hypothetical protein
MPVPAPIRCAVALAALLAFGAAQAANVVYTDRSAFTAATTGLTNIDFEAQNLTPNSFTYYGSGLNVGGVSFSVPNTP